MPSSPLLVTSVATAVALLIWQGRRKHQDPATTPKVIPGALPLFGHYFALSKNPRLFLDQAKASCGPIFQIQLPMLSGYVVTGPYVAEVLRSSRKDFSFKDGIETIVPLGRATEISYGHIYRGEGELNPRDKNPVSYPLKHNLGVNRVDNLSDRIEAASNEAFDFELNLAPGESKQVPVWPILTRMISRITCLCFAGRSVTEVPGFVESMASFTRKIIIAGTFLALLPRWLGDRVVRRFLSLKYEIDLILTHFTPRLEGHLAQTNAAGDEMTYGAWLLALPKHDGTFRTPRESAYQFKDVVLASIHTTSHFLTFALHELACRPALVQALRDEIGPAEFSPLTINTLPLLDSFLREVLRCDVDYLGLHHKAMRDVVMSNGQCIPKGTLVFLALDDANRVDNDVFDPYRFVNMNLEQKSATLTQDFMTFGAGPHACPGRHFAIMEIKYNIAKFVTRYNIKSTQPNGIRAPDSLVMGMTRNPPQDPILFEGR